MTAAVNIPYNTCKAPPPLRQISKLFSLQAIGGGTYFCLCDKYFVEISLHTDAFAEHTYPRPSCRETRPGILPRGGVFSDHTCVLYGALSHFTLPHDTCLFDSAPPSERFSHLVYLPATKRSGACHVFRFVVAKTR